MARKKVVRCHCNWCGRETGHDRVGERTVADDDPDSGYWWSYQYEMLQCRGCGSVCLRETYQDAGGENETYYYPPPMSRRPPVWRWDLPVSMREMLEEIYKALHNDSRRLALMGARTLMDMLMLEQVGDIGSFREKLEALRERGFIGARNSETMETALDAGSAAAHRGYKAETGDLNAVMDIVENVLETIYHLDKVAAAIRKRTPPRKPAK